MVARRRAVCLVPALLGGLGLIWASGVVFWLALGVVMVSLAGVLLPVQSRSARFAPMMVLDQGPRLHGPGRKIALAAEHQLRAAGIETVPSDDFYRRYDSRSFGVSRWEGHPNEEAHAIWAAELAAAIRPRPELARFRHMAEVAHDQQR
jgi:hypothetical protein